MSKRGMVTIVAPTCSAPFATTLNPVAWNNGATASARSSARIARAACCCTTLATQARWVSITPFGSPLVPLE